MRHILRELSVSGSLEPTPKFTKIYGNYCGPGNRGGEPIDALDAACKKHDKCYFHLGKGDCGCDDSLIKDVETVLANGKINFKQRMYGTLIQQYFLKKQKKKDC